MSRHALRVALRLVLVALAVFLGIMLGMWTRSLVRDKKRVELEKALHEVAEEEGDAAVLRLAGVPVKEILYGEQGVTVLTADIEGDQYSFSEEQNMQVYTEAGPSVVSVIAFSPSEGGNVPRESTGSGFFLSNEGYILTAAHVVDGYQRIDVSLGDDLLREAKLIGMDREDDLAVIRMTVSPGTRITPAKLGDSGRLVVGQKVIAIGSPFGYQKTLTTGIVSGLGRPVRTEQGTVIMNAIQSDVAANPGSSGGPLFNGKGEVVGIMSSIFTLSGSSSGVTFSIPVNTAVSLIPDLLRYGKVQRGWIDVTPVQLTPALASYARIPFASGILVSAVDPGGEAEKAGLRGGTEDVRYGDELISLGGDVIVGIDGVRVDDLNGLYLALLDRKKGEKVTVRVWRDGAYEEIPVTLAERQDDDIRSLVK